LQEFLFDRGNQWFRTIRQEPKKWKVEVWAEVYTFSLEKGEGWANRKDNFYVGNSKGSTIRKMDSTPGIVGTIESGE
jgi:hypothetical protein